MATKTHNLSIKTGTYMKDGKEKGRYLNIGSLFSHQEGGVSIKLDCVPVGLKDWDGWVNAWPVEPQQNTAQDYRAASSGSNEPPPFADDDVPNF